MAEISLELGLERCGRGHWAEMKHGYSRQGENKISQESWKRVLGKDRVHCGWRVLGKDSGSYGQRRR